MKSSNPNFSQLSKIEEDALIARLEAIRQTISHAGEKGRALESEVAALICSFLPSEYGISTGFVAYRINDVIELSPQLDLIIYDALRSGPIARLGSCDVFPLEATYAYLEVKASLCSTSDKANKYADNSIESCINKNETLRSMRQRAYHVITGINTSALKEKKWTPIRSYVFTFEPSGKVAKDPQKFATRVHEYMKRIGPKKVHMHGIFVGGSAYYSTMAVNPKTAKPEDWYHIKYTRDHLLVAFKWGLLHSLSRFPRFPNEWTPALDEYNDQKSDWDKYPIRSD